jgi:cytochrome c-type biogenesis protein CcmF
VLRSKLLAAVGTGVVVGAVAWGLRGFTGGSLYACTLGAAGFSGHLTIAELIRPGRERAARTGEGSLAVLVGIWRARRRTGAYVVHIGILLIAIGIATSSTYRQETGMTLQIEEEGEFAGYRLVLDDVERVPEPHRTGLVARLSAFHGDAALGTLSPRLNRYPARREPIGAPAVHTSWKEDLYLSVVQIDEAAGQASIRVIVEPLVAWIWWGGGVLLFGGLLILSEKRGRRADSSEAA